MVDGLVDCVFGIDGSQQTPRPVQGRDVVVGGREFPADAIQITPGRLYKIFDAEEFWKKGYGRGHQGCGDDHEEFH